MSYQRVSSFDPRWKYDVFLSFRGEDTRKIFTDILYHALKREGINVFRDNNELEKGKPISPELLIAIEQSRFSVVVFSKNYASSSWCLDELVKIVECIKEGKHTIFPVFYDVIPDVVKKQEGEYKEDFVYHERENKEKVQNWRKAMREVADIVGWGDVKNRHLSEVIQEIVKKIWSELPLSTSMNHEKLVGINPRKEQLMKLIEVKSNDVCMIGIWGMGGIGKTTIAKVIYETISGEFKSQKSFLANVRENFKRDGGVSLQKQLIDDILKKKDAWVPNSDEGIRLIKKMLKSQKVLIIIDDVDDINQLKALAGEHEWFHPGSRIIITTRDKHLLKFHGVNEVYKVEQLNQDDSIRLFSLKAFRKVQPLEDYVELSKSFVKYTGGVPLALEVLGSFLFGRDVEEWVSELERSNKEPQEAIFNILERSFDGLKKFEQEIFLDVACFFRGKDKDDAIKLWKACDFHPTIAISVLIEKCLIDIRHNQLWIHDLLQEMGKKKVKKESLKKPGNRSRLWEGAEIHDVLTKKKGTEAVEGIQLDMSKIKEMDLNPDAFAKMCNLRIFDFCCANAALEIKYDLDLLFPDNCSCNEENSKKVLASQPLEFASTDLAYFRWHRYPLKALPSRFNPEKLVALVMPHSEVEELWDGILPLGNLQHIKLSHSKHLTKIPDLSLAPNLESLILKGCTSLIEIHSSTQKLNKLAIVNLSGCSNLNTAQTFPCSIRVLHLDGTGISKFHLPDDPSRLEVLTLYNCSRLEGLPSSFCKLKRLTDLDLHWCSSLERLPDDLGKLAYLDEINVNGTAIRELPASITSLNCLSRLSFKDCKNLVLNFFSGLSTLRFLFSLNLIGCKIRELPDSLGQLYSLRELYLDKNNFERIPASIRDLDKLKFLGLSYCEKLQSLPELPGGDGLYVNMFNCVGLEELSDLSFLFSPTGSYKRINLANCFKLNVNALGNKVKDCLLKVQPSAFNRTFGSICLTGNEIPKWFSFQNEGSSMIIELPPDWNNKNFLGFFATCAVVEITDALDFEGSLYVNYDCYTKGDEYHYCRHSSLWYSRAVKHEWWRIDLDIQQDHVFLSFGRPEDRCFEEDYAFEFIDENKYIDVIDSNKANIEFNAFNEWDNYKVKKCDYKVKKCGVHLLNAQDGGKAKEEKEEEISNCENNFITGDLMEE